MVCQNCGEDCEYIDEFGCLYRDYDCYDGCDECEIGEQECKYESGEQIWPQWILWNIYNNKKR